jgi:hypothetical protein
MDSYTLSRSIKRGAGCNLGTCLPNKSDFISDLDIAPDRPQGSNILSDLRGLPIGPASNQRGHRS